nr:MAG TPA: Tas1 [Caudoviricetes sp.]
MPSDGLAEGTLKTIDELQARGFEITEIDNKFLVDNASYKAIHLQAKTPEGTLLEVQMHTNEDLMIKAEAHKIYELQRKLKPGVAEWQAYQDQMVALYNKLPDPKDIRKVRTFKGGKR